MFYSKYSVWHTLLHLFRSVKEKKICIRSCQMRFLRDKIVNMQTKKGTLGSAASDLRYTK